MGSLGERTQPSWDNHHWRKREVPRLGVHMSIAGGVDESVLRGADAGCDAIQIFTSSSRTWKTRDLSPDEIKTFHTNCRNTGIHSVVAHDSYLVNLASADKNIRRKSITVLTQELRRCHLLRIPYLVIHPGSATDGNESIGISRIADALQIVLRSLPSARTVILLETTAGQGNCIGNKFEDLAAILSLARFPKRLGVCLDTCHVFAAGYEIRTRKSYRDTMRELDESVGIHRLHVFHLNDSKKEIGSRVDRHEHIGEGCLGLEPFQFLLNDKRFENHPMLLETPKGPDLRKDLENLRVLRNLIRK